MTEYIKTLEEEFKRHANPEIAIGQKAYMKNQFEFFGIKTTERRTVIAPFLHKDFLPSQKDAEKNLQNLWLRPEREFQYFAQELALCYQKQLKKSDLALFEFMILNKSWWDTVDFIAPKLVGPYFKNTPNSGTKRWKNGWLRATSG